MRAGRPNHYDLRIKPRLLEIAAWCRDGLTDKEIGQLIGVSHTTFIKYKKLEVEFLDALKINKNIADIQVENSLFKRANGYEYEETVKEIHTDDDGKVKSKHVKKTTKQVAPDVTAQIFWLKNRKMKEWRDTKNMEHSGPDGGPIETITSEMDAKKAAKIYSQMIKEDE